MGKLRFEVDYDELCGDLFENHFSGWKLYVFSRRYRNYVDPQEFLKWDDIKEKLKNGFAHYVSLYSHGGDVWALEGELPVMCRCPWDSVSRAGVLVLDDDREKDMPDTYEKRKEDARVFIEEYAKWARGEVYRYEAYEPGATDWFDSCSGIVGMDNLLEAVCDCAAGREFEVSTTKTVVQSSEVGKQLAEMLGEKGVTK